MKRIILLSLVIVSPIFLGCPDYVEDPYPPSPPVFVDKTYPTDQTEQGIGAYNFNTETPEKNSIRLMWHPNAEDDLAGYKLYRAREVADEIEDFELIKIVDIAATLTGRDTFYIDTEPQVLRRYYYFLKSYDLAGNNSEPSDTVSYKLLNKPQAFPIHEGTPSHNIVFNWDENQLLTEYPQNSLIRINNTDNETIWACLFQYPFDGYYFNFAPNGEEVNIYAVIEFNGIEGYLPPGQYFWKVKALRMGNGITTDADNDIAGAESDWIEFIIEE